MKTKTLSLVLFCVLVVGFQLQAQVKVIERPTFESWSSATLELNKIEVNDNATIFYIDAFYYPGQWIRIDKGTYIREAGSADKLLVTGTEGIELDSLLFISESGTTSFKLIFPPIAKNVSTIDFIESDCPDCFKIWGINLDPNKKIVPIKLPQEVISSMKTKNDTPLPKAEIKSAMAVLSGQILGNHLPNDVVNKTFRITFMNLITKGQEQYDIAIQKDGSFRKEIPVVSPTIAMSSDFFSSVVLIPGEESKVFVDLQKRSLQQSRYHKDTLDNSSSAYMINSLNLTPADLSYISEIPYKYDRRQTLRDVYNMDSNAYKSYLYKKMNESIEKINNDINLSTKGKQIAIMELKIYNLLDLFSFEQNLKISYIVNNNLPYMPMDSIPYTPEKPTASYYSFVKDFSLNDQDWIYSPTFVHIIGLIRNAAVYNIPTEKTSLPEWRMQAINKLKNDMGSDSGLFFDLLVAQECATQLEEMQAFTDTQKAEMNQIFSNKAYISQLLAENDKVLKLTEENSHKKGFVVNDVPAVAQEDVLNAILAKYKGKVVFVDVWATWCGPCVQAMKTAEPVKTYFEGKEVVFLYLTGETSPMRRWQEMIPDIHGEHYRVSNEQWDYWYSKLGIEGVPTYFIFDKKGVQTHKNTGFMGVDNMKEWISESL